MFFNSFFIGANQIMLSTWNIATSTYLSKSLSVSSQDVSPVQTAFDPTGSIFYMAATNASRVIQYTLSTPWDISTGLYAAKYLDTFNFAPAIILTGVAISPDGTKAYCSGSGSPNGVYQFTLATAFDISTATYASKSFSTVPQLSTSVPTNVHLSTDGTQCYVYFGGIIYQYTMSVAFDVSTATYSSKTLDMTANIGTTAGYGFDISSDGFHLYAVDRSTYTLFQYTLGIAWDVSTGTYASKSYMFSAETTVGQSMTLKPDGLKWYLISSGATASIFEYSIT